MARLGIGIVVAMVVLAGCGTYTGVNRARPCVRVTGSALCRAAAPTVRSAGGLRRDEKRADLERPKAHR